jgi:predicted methyltransferase
MLTASRRSAKSIKLIENPWEIAMNAKVPVAAAIGLALFVGVAAAAPADLAAAVADPHRPDGDRARDAARRPAEVLAFAGLKPGDKVLELLPGHGYFTRVISVAVGPAGHVYTTAPSANPETGKPVDPNPVAGDPAYGNVTGVAMALGKPLTSPEPVDLIFTAQNYHDLHLSRFKLDVVAMDKDFFAALKPGGVLIIEDHAAEPGSGLRDPDRLHRIDEAVVKQEVLSAGFVLDGESDVLRNPADTHTLIVFDPAIRGHTDQFVLRFRKPG